MFGTCNTCVRLQSRVTNSGATVDGLFLFVCLFVFVTLFAFVLFLCFSRNLGMGDGDGKH